MFRGERTCKNNAWKIFSFGWRNRAEKNLVICSHFCRDSANFILNTETFSSCQTTTIHAINKAVKVIALKRFVSFNFLDGKSFLLKAAKSELENPRRIHSRTVQPFINHILISTNNSETCSKLFSKGDQKNAAAVKTNKTFPAFPKSLADRRKNMSLIDCERNVCGFFFLSGFHLTK